MAARPPVLNLDGFDRRAVSINGVFCPLGSVPASLKRFCRPAMFYNEGSPFEVSISGSSLLVRYQRRKFAVFTRHQLGRIDQAASRHETRNFVILLENADRRRVAITPSAALHPVPNAKFESLGDLTIVEFADEQLAGKSGADFFDLDMEMPAGSAIVSLAIGYPSFAVEMDVSEEGALTSVNMASATLYLSDADAAEPFDPEHRKIMVQHDRAQRTLPDPDGMSGAPVFSLRPSSGGLLCRLAGIITHARHRRFAVLSEQPLRKALDLCLQSEADEP